MAGENVLNRFEQADASGDNKLILDGTVETGAGADLKTKLFTVTLDDLATQVDNFVSVGFAGTIVRITATVSDAFSTGTAIFEFIGPEGGGGQTLQFSGGAAAGATITTEFTADGAFEANESIQVSVASGSNPDPAPRGTAVVEVLPN